MQVKQIKRVSSLSDFSVYVKNKQPVIFEKYGLNWTASRMWDVDFFKNNFGNLKIEFAQYFSNINPDFTNIHQWSQRKSSLQEYFEDNFQGSEYKLFRDGIILHPYHHYKYNPDFELLQKYFSIPDFLDINTLQTIGLWISSKGTISWLHFDKDHSENFNVQVVGSKYVCLYDPKDVPNLSLKSALETVYYNFSNIDVRNKFESHSIIKYEATLEKGDMLYIPQDWLHSFTHLEELNINLTFWWHANYQLYNSLHARDNYIIALIKCFQTIVPNLSLKTTLLHKEHEALHQLAQYMKSYSDLEIFKKIEREILNTPYFLPDCNFNLSRMSNP